MRVFIAEASYPHDFYKRTLDGASVASLLDTIKVRHIVRFVLDQDHLKKALNESARTKSEVFHLSCHGDQNGPAIGADAEPTWLEFAGLFQGLIACPKVLVMSSCCGAHVRIAKAFEDCHQRPDLIIGSTRALKYSRYSVAWAVLYHRLKLEGLTAEAASSAIKQISVVASRSFVCRYWNSDREAYDVFPSAGVRFRITEKSAAS